MHEDSLPFDLYHQFLVYHAFWIQILKCKKEKTIKNIFLSKFPWNKSTFILLLQPSFFSYSIKNFYITHTGKNFICSFIRKIFWKLRSWRVEGFSSVPQTRDIEKRKRFEADKEGKMVERCNYPRVCGPFARKIAP